MKCLLPVGAMLKITFQEIIYARMFRLIIIQHFYILTFFLYPFEKKLICAVLYFLIFNICSRCYNICLIWHDSTIFFILPKTLQFPLIMSCQILQQTLTIFFRILSATLFFRHSFLKPQTPLEMLPKLLLGSTWKLIFESVLHFFQLLFYWRMSPFVRWKTIILDLWIPKSSAIRFFR